MIQSGLNSCLHHPFNLQLRLNGNSLLKNQHILTFLEQRGVQGARPRTTGSQQRAPCSEEFGTGQGHPGRLQKLLCVDNTAGFSLFLFPVPGNRSFESTLRNSAYLAANTQNTYQQSRPGERNVEENTALCRFWERAEEGCRDQRGEGYIHPEDCPGWINSGSVPFQTTSQLSVPCCRTHWGETYAQFSFIKPRMFQ